MTRRIKSTTRNPRLLKERKVLIDYAVKRGLLNMEIAEIFKTTESNISMIRQRGRQIKYNKIVNKFKKAVNS